MQIKKLSADYSVLFRVLLHEEVRTWSDPLLFQCNYEFFHSLKILSASVVIEPAILGFRSKRATSEPQRHVKDQSKGNRT